MKRRNHRAPNIFQYHDYRAFLKDWLEYLRSSDHKISLRQIAKNSKVSVAYLSMVIKGSRSFSDEMLEKTLPCLKLSEEEEKYFRFLRVVGDSESAEERTKALNELQQFANYKRHNKRELEVYRYLSHWYFVAIREMAAMPDFQADPKWIKDHLLYPVSIPEITKALKFLIQFKFIEILPDGKARLPEKRIDCFGGVYKMALGKFHREMFSLASESIDTTPREFRDLSFYTMAIAPENFEKVRAILEEALNKVAEVGAATQNAKCVYHVSFASFPLTKLPGPAKVGST